MSRGNVRSFATFSSSLDWNQRVEEIRLERRECGMMGRKSIQLDKAPNAGQLSRSFRYEKKQSMIEYDWMVTIVLNARSAELDDD